MRRRVVSFPHRAPVVGGPGTFQILIENSLRQCGWKITYSWGKERPDIVFVIGGTAKVGWLLFEKLRGAKVIQRLDGLGWKPFVVESSVAERAAAYSRNVILRVIRDWCADRVVYQSRFVKSWWLDRHGSAGVSECVIYNGADLSVFSPRPIRKNRDHFRILCVEGAVGDDISTITTIVSLVARSIQFSKQWEFLICGDVGAKFTQEVAHLDNVTIRGRVPRHEMPDVYRGCDVYMALEINPPCPNAVIEAMASGLPVVGFDTGSLSELILPDGGVAVPYGGNPWKLDIPAVNGLFSALEDVEKELAEKSIAARRQAESRFGLDTMVESYLEEIEKLY
jgi:glycosyltransferase involved in cell wall biosynthesis